MDWKRRFVVFDCETTGTNPERDHLISIAGIAIEDGEICLKETFEELVRVPYNTASVLVHGITQEEASTGLDESEAVQRFLSFAGDSMLVGHHVGFDLAILRRVAERRTGHSLPNPAIDTMELLIRLGRHGAFGEVEEISHFDLDSVCTRFELEPHDRHTAPGDAFLTAQIFLKLMHAAHRIGLEPPVFDD